MNTRRVTLLVAVVLAIGTGVLTLRYLTSINQQAQQQQQQVDLKHVIIANHDIPARAKITPDMLTSVSRPAAEVPQQALSDPKQAEGDVALITIPQGSPLTSATIGQPAEVGLTFRLKPGMRAVSIPVDKVKAVSGLIQPGDHVDVMAAVHSGAGIPPKTFTIIRGATILAINTQLEQTGTDGSASPAPDSGAGGGATVTLGVTPEQADLLTVADLNTTLRLALRSPQEPIRSLPAEPLEFADLGSPGGVPAPAVAVAAPLPYPVPTPAAAAHDTNVPAPKIDDGIEIIDGDKVISAQ